MTSVAHTVDYYRARATTRGRWTSLALLAVSVLLATLVVLDPPGWYALLIAICAAVAIATWNRPAAGVAALLGAAVLFEQYPFARFTPITLTVPFFQSLSTFAHVGGLAITPFEIGLAAVAGIVGVRGLVKRVRWRAGGVLPIVTPFMAALAFWAAYGLASGGSVPVAVSEVRAFVYFAAFVVLTGYSVADERDIRLILSVAAAAVVFKALQALWAYAVVLNYNMRGVESLTGHEDAVFMAWMIVLLAVSLAYKSMPRLSASLLVTLPAIGSAFVLTDRRAAYVALGIGLIVLAMMLLSDAGKRRLVASIAPPLALAALLAIGSGWTGSGPFARPAAAVRSISSPDTMRDEQSNYYRKAEEVSLVLAIRKSPIVGLGFGRPFVSSGQLAKIGYQYAEFIAHNQILWLWAKLGTLGFAVFWIMAGGLICYGVVVFRGARTPLQRTVAATATCALVMQLIVSYVDMQLTFARNMTFLGVLIGLLAAVACMEVGEPDAKS